VLRTKDGAVLMLRSGERIAMSKVDRVLGEAGGAS
jgi:hypothetical protein